MKSKTYRWITEDSIQFEQNKHVEKYCGLLNLWASSPLNEFTSPEKPLDLMYHDLDDDDDDGRSSSPSYGYAI